MSGEVAGAPLPAVGESGKGGRIDEPESEGPRPPCVADECAIGIGEALPVGKSKRIQNSEIYVLKRRLAFYRQRVGSRGKHVINTSNASSWGDLGREVLAGCSPSSSDQIPSTARKIHHQSNHQLAVHLSGPFIADHVHQCGALIDAELVCE